MVNHLHSVCPHLGRDKNVSGISSASCLYNTLASWRYNPPEDNNLKKFTEGITYKYCEYCTCCSTNKKVFWNKIHISLQYCFPRNNVTADFASGEVPTQTDISTETPGDILTPVQESYDASDEL